MKMLVTTILLLAGLGGCSNIIDHPAGAYGYVPHHAALLASPHERNNCNKQQFPQCDNGGDGN